MLNHSCMHARYVWFAHVYNVVNRYDATGLILVQIDVDIACTQF